MSTNTFIAQCSPNSIRVIANNLAEKYENLDSRHIFWIAKELNIYPDGKVFKKNKLVDMTKTGKINRDCTDYVTNGKINDNGISAIENFLQQEGYKKMIKKEEVSMQITSIWEQADLIAMMKKDYDKAVADRDAAKSEADSYCKLADKYEKEIDELKDKLLIAEKENSALKEEKIQLGKMQLKTVDFNKEIDNLQKRIAQYNAEINAVSAEVNEFRKDVSVLITGVSQLQEKKKKLEGVMSDLVGCSKRLMNMK